MSTTRYVIDELDRVVEVNPGFAEFARANGAPDLAWSVIGKPLWNAIAGVEVAHLYQELLARVRQSGRRIEIPFRCDAPDRRRYQRLTIVPEHDGFIHFAAHLDREEMRAPVPFPKTATATAASSQSVITMCSWCKQIRLDEWTEFEAVLSGGLLLDPPEAITHGMCPSCAERMTSALS